MFKRCKSILLGGLCLAIPLGCGHRQGSVVAPPIAKISQGSPFSVEQSATRDPIQTSPQSSQTPQTLMILPASVRTFKSKPSAIQFDYPGDWVADKAATACFAVHCPNSPKAGHATLCLDIPKLPWHMAGLLSVNMVASGYISDLKKHQIQDAVVKEQCPITAGGCTGQRITCCGHTNGNPSMDIAVILIHADQVFILSADSDDAGFETASKTLDAAVASLKWTK